MKENKDEIFLGQGNTLNLKSIHLVNCHQTLTLITVNEGAVTLNVKIEADFNEIPEKYREVFMNMMTAKYLNTTSFGDNPFSECLPLPKRKWYQFWRSK
jgi:hypothetical protein